MRPFHHGNLRRALIDVALELTRKRGPAGFTLREAARQVGVTQAAPYRHFSSREALLAVIAEEGFRTMRECMVRAMERAGAHPLMRFQAQGAAYVLFALDHPAHFRVMFETGVRFKKKYASLIEAADAAFELLWGSIEECQAAQLFRPVDRQELGLSIHSIVHGLAMLIVSGQGVEALSRQDAESLALRAAAAIYCGYRPESPEVLAGLPLLSPPARTADSGPFAEPRNSSKR